MANARRFSFSLLTLFLLTVIVALSVSHFVMMRQLRDARLEIESVRREFGYLQIHDPQRIYIAQIEGGESIGYRYRMHIPPGHRYLLHIADTEIPDTGYPDHPRPTRTISMNSWRNGADVILNCGIFIDDDGTPRLKVTTDSEELFDYRLENWNKMPGPNEGSHLQTDPQKSFLPDETIQFMWWGNSFAKRGIMLWMEPLKE
jgi:hypothetical protein